MMKAVWTGVLLAAMAAQGSLAQQERRWLPPRSHSEAEQELLKLSREKWQWMAERRVDALESLFHEEAFFVHMGATMTRSQELGVIRSGGIHYKQADIQEATARVLGDTAIVLNRIRLVAVVGGNEVTNPFMVTEVYVRESGRWKLAVLSFTRLMDAPPPQAGAGARPPQAGAAATRRRPSQGAIGDFAPKLAEITDDVLYGDIWERPQLSRRDRSLATVAALIAMNRPDQLRSHLRMAIENGLTRDELVETITHLAFYAGWPSAVTAIGVAREILGGSQPR